MKGPKDRMLKVVVFDDDGGGENVADYVAQSLGMVTVERVIGSEDGEYERRSLSSRCRQAKEILAEYIGKVDLIVLGGYMSSQVICYLERIYPEQKFVGVGIDYDYVWQTRIPLERIVLLTDERWQCTTTFDELLRRLSQAEIYLPDCSGWESLLNAGKLDSAMLRCDLQDRYCLAPARPRKVNGPQTHLAEKPNGVRVRPDTVIVLNTHFWTLREELEEVFGCGVRIIDFREKLLHDVCRALGLRGVDGKRRR